MKNLTWFYHTSQANTPETRLDFLYSSFSFLSSSHEQILRFSFSLSGKLLVAFDYSANLAYNVVQAVQLSLPMTKYVVLCALPLAERTTPEKVEKKI